MCLASKVVYSTGIRFSLDWSDYLSGEIAGVVQYGSVCVNGASVTDLDVSEYRDASHDQFWIAIPCLGF